MSEVTEHALEGLLKGKTVIVGVGNIMRGDDGFGPLLIDALKDAGSIVCIDAGTTPENYTGVIAREAPDTVIIADAVHLGAGPGEYTLLQGDDIARSGFSTHNRSPDMFINYLEAETGAEIYLLAAQPRTLALGAPVSDDMNITIHELAQRLKEADHA